MQSFLEVLMAQVTHSLTLVSLNRVSYQFPNGETLFDAIDLRIDRTCTAIVGRNGIGKSILAALIAERLQPTAGTIERYGSIAYVAQSTDAIRNTTVAQLSGLAPILDALARVNAGDAHAEDFDLIGENWDLADRFRSELETAGMSYLRDDDAADQLSGGQRARIALAGALLSDADLLILDEPSNHLDHHAHNWLLERLNTWQGGLLIVSHDRALLHEVDRIIELTPLGPRIYGGDYTWFQQSRESEQQAAIAALDHVRTKRTREKARLQREHDTIQRRAANTRRHADTANVSRPERFAMKNAAVEIMGHVRKHKQAFKEQMDARIQTAAAAVLPTETVLLALPDTIVPARKGIAALDGVRLPWLRDDDPAALIDLHLEGPVRVAVIGPNGCGKSTLLRILAGELQPLVGTCMTYVPSAYLDQSLAMLDGHRSVVEQLGLLDTPLVEGALRSRLALLQIDARRATLPINQLSGGERLKAALACALWRGTPAQLLLLDEPTNHLDLESVLAFEQALQTFPGAIIAVSHDENFLNALLPTHILRWSTQGWRFETVEAITSVESMQG